MTLLGHRRNHFPAIVAIAATTIAEIEKVLSQQSLSLRSLENGFHMIAAIAVITAIVAIMAIIWKPGFTSLLSNATVSKTLNMVACENSGPLCFLFTSVLLFYLHFAFLFVLCFFICVSFFSFAFSFFVCLRFLFCLCLSLLGHRTVPSGNQLVLFSLES